MNTWVKAIVLLVGLTATAGAASAFVVSHMQNREIYSYLLESLGKLELLDNRWSLEVIRVSTNPQADFDGLATLSASMSNTKNAVANAVSETQDLSERERNDLRSYLSLLDSKAERIERFKSGYAIVRNSQRYLPSAALTAAEERRRDGQPELAAQIESRAKALEAFLVTPREELKSKLSASLVALEEQATASPTGVTQALSIFLAHGDVLLKEKGRMDALLTKASSESSNSEAHDLQKHFSSLVDVQKEADQRSDLVTMACTGALFVLILISVLSASNPKSSKRAAPPKKGKRAKKPEPAAEDLDVGDMGGRPLAAG